MPSPAVIVGLFVIPLAIFGINISARSMWTMPQSAAADLVLVLVAFDLSAILAPKTLERLTVSDFVDENFTPFFLAMAVIGLFLWTFSLRLERSISWNFHQSTGRYRTFPVVLWGSAWVIAATLLFAHFLAFASKEPLWNFWR